MLRYSLCLYYEKPTSLPRGLLCCHHHHWGKRNKNESKKTIMTNLKSWYFAHFFTCQGIHTFALHKWILQHLLFNLTIAHHQNDFVTQCLPGYDVGCWTRYRSFTLQKHWSDLVQRLQSRQNSPNAYQNTSSSASLIVSSN